MRDAAQSLLRLIGPNQKTARYLDSSYPMISDYESQSLARELASSYLCGHVMRSRARCLFVCRNEGVTDCSMEDCRRSELSIALPGDFLGANYGSVRMRHDGIEHFCGPTSGYRNRSGLHTQSMASIHRDHGDQPAPRISFWPFLPYLASVLLGPSEQVST